MADEPYWTRVRVKETGDHISVHVVNPAKHVPLKQPGANAFGRPYPAKPNIGHRPATDTDTATTETE